ncbi:MAG: DNA polymerase III subunit gamma/tau [Actinomycetota bacterium]
MAAEQQHQALYRRYRPQNPQEILGQDHVVRALTGAIGEDRLAHAFLFCGPRGTGKTSTARILAKMVNCEQGPTAEPCGVCDQCVAIRDGHHLDVFEIDAASHGGVEDARELREKAPTAPAYGREKVYIIDEAQRLSREAFDALLKVFEEPPPGVRFVLATTEPHKMPATIVGRCQRFDFRRASLETISDHLQHIAKDESIELSPTAAAAIARQAEGSFRDSLSLLDQAMVIAAGADVDDAIVATLLGTPRAEIQRELADAVAVGDARTVFEIIHRLVLEGHDLRHLTSETLGHFRNLLLVRSAPGEQGLIDATSDEYERLRQQAEKFQPAELSRVISLLLEAQADMRWTTSPRISLELALVRATMPETDPEPAGMLARMERLERLAGVEGSPGGVVPAPAPVAASAPSPADDPAPAPQRQERAKSKSSRKKKEVPAPRATGADDAPFVELSPVAEVDRVPEAAKATAGSGDPALAPVQPVVHAASTDAIDVDLFRKSWPSFIEHLQAQRQPILKALLETATPATYDGTTLELAFPPDRTFGVKKVEERAPELRAALEAVFGVTPQVRCVVREATARANDPDPDVDDETPPTEEEALQRLKQQLGAEEEDEATDGVDGGTGNGS